MVRMLYEMRVSAICYKNNNNSEARLFHFIPKKPLARLRNHVSIKWTVGRMRLSCSLSCCGYWSHGELRGCKQYFQTIPGFPFMALICTISHRPHEKSSSLAGSSSLLQMPLEQGLRPLIQLSKAYDGSWRQIRDVENTCWVKSG